MGEHLFTIFSSILHLREKKPTASVKSKQNMHRAGFFHLWFLLAPLLEKGAHLTVSAHRPLGLPCTLANVLYAAPVMV